MVPSTTHTHVETCKICHNCKSPGWIVNNPLRTLCPPNDPVPFDSDGNPILLFWRRPTQTSWFTDTRQPFALKGMTYRCTLLTQDDYSPSTVWPIHHCTPLAKGDHSLLMVCPTFAYLWGDHFPSTVWPTIAYQQGNHSPLMVWLNVTHNRHWLAIYPQQAPYCCTSLTQGDCSPSTVWPTVAQDWQPTTYM